MTALCNLAIGGLCVIASFIAITTYDRGVSGYIDASLNPRTDLLP